MPRLQLALALALAASAQGALAQSAFSIPNPIIKPQSVAAGTGVGLPKVAQANGTPAVRPADSGGQPVPQVPPLPESIGAPPALPGARIAATAPANETIIRDTLATFTVTAIVGNRAVLRNNVGAIQVRADASRDSGAEPSRASNGSAAPAQPRQAVIRVKSDTPVYVAGIELVPTVLDSRVEFRLAGRRPVVATVALESLSSYGYAPPAASKEVADPAVQQRVTPTSSGSFAGGSNGTYGSGGSGGALGSNGLTGAQR